jgi:D-threo-aldose 1-dehydrogenase
MTSVWKALRHDAVQKIGYDGIMECFEQGNELLGVYTPKMVSVHDGRVPAGAEE